MPPNRNPVPNSTLEMGCVRQWLYEGLLEISASFQGLCSYGHRPASADFLQLLPFFLTWN